MRLANMDYALRNERNEKVKAQFKDVAWQCFVLRRGPGVSSGLAFVVAII